MEPSTGTRKIYVLLGRRSRAPPTSRRAPASSRGRRRCSRPGSGSRHLPQPEHSSGMMITSMPWLKIAPNCGGQWRMQVSQLMQIDMSMQQRRVLPLRVALVGREPVGSRRPAASAPSALPVPGAATLTARSSDSDSGSLGCRARHATVDVARSALRAPSEGATVAKYEFLTDEWMAEAQADPRRGRHARPARRRTW